MYKLLICSLIYLFFLPFHSLAQESFTEDFSNSVLSEFWQGNTDKFSVLNDTLFPTSLVKTDGHFLASNSSSGKLSILTPSNVTDAWSFSLGTPDFSPSSLNYIGVVLMSDVAFAGDINMFGWHGYFLRIGDDALDKIALYKRNGNVTVKVGDFDTPSFSDGALKNGLTLNVIRSGNAFKLSYAVGFTTTDSMIDAGELYDDTFLTSSFFGFFQQFNSPSPQRRLFIDQVTTQNFHQNYTWTGVISGDINTAENWDPSRVEQFSTDKLVFSNGQNVFISGLKNLSLKGIVVSNNTSLTLRASTAVKLFLTGMSNVNDSLNLYIDSTSKLIFDAGAVVEQPIQLSLLSGAKASIFGQLIFTDSYDHSIPAHRLLATDSAAIIFKKGSFFIAEDLDNSPFGQSGQNNTVLFEDGSTYWAIDGASPFGKAQPGTKVFFSKESKYIHANNVPLSLAGRVYGNILVDYTGNIYITSGSVSASPCAINNLHIKNGHLLLQLNLNKQPQNIDISGNLQIDAYASFQLVPSDTISHSVIRFCGSTLQSICGSGDISFGKNSTVKLSNSSNIQLLRDIHIQGALSFENNAKLLLNNNNLEVDSLIQQASNTQFVVSNATKEDSKGFLIRTVKHGVGTTTFPMGSSLSDYTPCVLENNLASTSRVYLKVFDSVYVHGKSGDLFPSQSLVNKTWEINPEDSLHVTLSLQWNEMNEGVAFNRSACTMVKNRGVDGHNQWQEIASNEIVGENPYVVSASVNTFSKFSVFGSEIPLPVSLLFAHMECKNDEIEIRWSTATESNCDKYAIQYAEDGTHFTTIAEIAGAGNSNTPKNYEVRLNQPQQGYYLLVQYDYNGNETQLSSNYVDCQPKNKKPILLIHRESTLEGRLIFEYLDQSSNSVTIRVMNSTGQIIHNQEYKANVKQCLSLGKAHAQSVIMIEARAKNTFVRESILFW